MISNMEELKSRLSAWAYYIVIAIVSAIAILVPPICAGGIQGDVGIYFPSDEAGWLLWGISNGAVVVVNLSILTLFKLQAKRNCKDDPNFKKASEIIGSLRTRGKEKKPMSPAKMNSEDFISKGLSLTVTTIASFVAIGSIAMSFDAMAFLSAAISVASAVCMSWVTMIRNEEYWKTEYLVYAEWKAKGANNDDSEKPSAASREE